MIRSGGMYWRLPDRGERELGPMECAALSGSMSAWSADLESFPDDVPARPRSSPPGRAPAPAAARRYRRVDGPARPGTLPGQLRRGRVQPADHVQPLDQLGHRHHARHRRQTTGPARRSAPAAACGGPVNYSPDTCPPDPDDAGLNNRIVPGPRTPIVISPQRSAPLIADAGSDRMELDEKHSAHYELRLTTYVTATGGCKHSERCGASTSTVHA
jgi:hypothetical protein